jgi:hypothetical protein
MRAVGMGLWVEEHREELADAWRKAVAEGDGSGREPGLGFALAPLLRQMALELRGEGEAHRAARPAGEGMGRCAVLVRSSAEPAQLAREFKLLRRVIWDATRSEGNPVGQDERRAVDEWLDDALVTSLGRLERVRLRVEAFERGPMIIPRRSGPELAPQAISVVKAAPVAAKAAPHVLGPVKTAPLATVPVKAAARPPPLPWHRPPGSLPQIRPAQSGTNGVSHGGTWER